MVVRRPAEGLHRYIPVARESAEEVGLEGVPTRELQTKIAIKLRQVGFFIRHDAVRVERRVLRRLREEEAIGNGIDVNVLRQMARQRADVANADHRVKAQILLHLEAETLHVRYKAFTISAANARRAERDGAGV